VYDDSAYGPLRVQYLDLYTRGPEAAGIPHLAACLGVERRAVEYDLHLAAGCGFVDATPVDEQRRDFRSRADFAISQKLRRNSLVRERREPLRLRAERPLTDAELFEVCRLNRELRIERSSTGEIIIMPPTRGETGRRNASLTAQLARWSERDGTGVSFDSSTGFILPNGAERSPDAAWVRRERWEALADDQRDAFPPLCPDFVGELRSPSDDLSALRAKMKEYQACGATLGWLVDPLERRVHIYRLGAPTETVSAPTSVSAEPTLRGFTLDLSSIWT
jgi:Uma2 family endonuclease